MSMTLSIDSTLHEIEKAHQCGMGIKQIASALSVGENKLRKILGMAGYEYDSSIKKWRYTRLDESKDVRDRSFWSLDEYGVGKPDNTGKLNSNMGNKISNTESNTGNTDSSMSNIESNKGNTSNMSSNTSNNFTVDDIEIIHALIAQYKATAPSVTDSTDILQAIQGIKKGNTTKKTFALDNDLIDQLDAFCDTHRIKKSDFVMMAIQDALDKFNS